MSTDEEVVPCCREGNRTSGVALAMGHRRCGISTTYGLNGWEIAARLHSSKVRGRLYIL